MIRQTMRSVALAAAGLLLAGVAWGQPVLTQGSSDAQLVAKEHFGGDPRVVNVSKMDMVPDVDGTANTIGTQRPYVELTLSDATPDAGAVGNIDDGNTADITFELTGATFEQAAGSTNLKQFTAAQNCNPAFPAGSTIEGSVMKGGAKGDSSVTYRVEVTDAGGGTTFDAGQAICFLIPDLSVSNGSVSVEASIKPVATTGVSFPSAIAFPEAKEAKAAAKAVLAAEAALTASLGTGDTAFVNVADRTKIATGGTQDPSGDSKTMGLKVGTLSVAVSQKDIWKLTGDDYLPKDQIDGSLSGQITVTVGGTRPYGSGDRVLVGSGATALSGTISGMAAEATVQTAVDSLTIVYVPGGVDNLKPGPFMAAAEYKFNDRRNVSGASAMIKPPSTGMIKYAGVEVEGYAYGVVRGGGTDTSFVRVTCRASADCAVFLDCTDQAGMNYFDATPPVAAGGTSVWNSAAIAGVLGGGWASGRGRCDIHSTGQLSVQHMVRSGDTLVNSSTVVGRSLDESRDTRIAAIRTVVDNICASVVGHKGRDAHLGDADNPKVPDTSGPNGTDDPSNNVSAIDPTPCVVALLATEIADTVDTNGDKPGF